MLCLIYILVLCLVLVLVSGDRDLLCRFRRAEWAFYLRTEADSRFRNVVLNRNRTVDSVQKVSNCDNIPS
jgi:hypothetical protein